MVPGSRLGCPLSGRRQDLRAVAGARRVHPEPGRELTAPALSARGLAKSFGEVVALDGVDLDVAEGDIHGLIGPNGAGKTTLLGLLLGLTRPDAGELTIRVADVAGFVDGPGLYPALTARGNLRALADLRGDGREMIDGVPTQVGLGDVADDRVRGFSLGMRQRLGLAAALLTRPRLLVLDEPANGLDPAGKRHVHSVLAELAEQGTAVVLSSHRMDDLAALCGGVTLLSAGRVVFSGRVGELVAEVDELEYRLRTSDLGAASRIAAGTAGLTILPDTETLLVRATVPVLDDLVARLVGAGIGVRELTPAVAPLEAAFLALTAEQA